MVLTSGLKNYSDVYFTDEELAKKIIMHFNPQGKCLEPFLGEGAFWNHLPGEKDWCEIVKGKDFFAYKNKVNWIITNPPFSNLTEVFQHSFSISDNCVFLIPISKYFSSSPRIRLVKEYGGLVEIVHCGTGRDIRFNMGFPFGALYFKRNYNGTIKESFLDFRYSKKKI